MAYQRKTQDVWNLWGDYGQGGEILTAELTSAAAFARRAEYRANEPGLRLKITCNRERIEP